MTDIKDPWIIKNFFNEKKYDHVMKYINSIDKKNWKFTQGFNRYTYSSKYLNKLSILELDRARKEFNNKTLLHSYSLLSLYNNKDSSLYKHKDNNACTYTFDICLYSEKPWPIYVENKEYILNNNEALCFYGEDQWHWRESFPENNKVLMLFMHWVDRDHEFFNLSNFGDQ